MIFLVSRSDNSRESLQIWTSSSAPSSQVICQTSDLGLDATFCDANVPRCREEAEASCPITKKYATFIHERSQICGRTHVTRLLSILLPPIKSAHGHKVDNVCTLHLETPGRRWIVRRSLVKPWKGVERKQIYVLKLIKKPDRNLDFGMPNIRRRVAEAWNEFGESIGRFWW